MLKTQPRIIISALRGGSGKTVLTLGLAAAWADKGYRVAPYKKGPDFIDAGWLSFAAKKQCYNLDSFLMTEDQIRHSFVSHFKDADLALIEGNRGLYDGLDAEGSCSTAQLAKLLHCPVLLVVDVSMATRTIAALVRGCQVFDPDLNIAGVILNRVSGQRQKDLITRAVEKACGIPVVGAVPRQKDNRFPERHMGLIPFQEKDQAEKAVSWAKSLASEHLQIKDIFDMARKADAVDLSVPEPVFRPLGEAGTKDPVHIGVIQDKSFWFYYPENLTFLEQFGAKLVKISAISDAELPQLDALYIGGGFPETQARSLAANQRFRQDLKNRIAQGLPVYAECGGLMYLGQGLVLNGETFPMVGSLPILFHLDKKPQGHGYTVFRVEQENPYFEVGETVRGHEFHYSRPVLTGNNIRFAFTMDRGSGIFDRRDGVCMKNLLATYTHIHSAGHPSWARNLVKAALAWKVQRDH